MSETAKGVGNLKQEVDGLVKTVQEFSTRNPGENIPETLKSTIDELTRYAPTTTVSASSDLTLYWTANGRRSKRVRQKSSSVVDSRDSSAALRMPRNYRAL